MSWIILILFALCCACTSVEAPPAEVTHGDLVLRYDRPAKYFEEALPLGNGTLGAMVYGDTYHERISLNDITLWTGEPDRGPGHPDLITAKLDSCCAEALQAVRDALDNEDYEAADTLQHKLQGHYSESYMPLGNLRLDFPKSEISEYSRSLDIATATATVSCKRDGVPFCQTCYISAPDSVMVLQISSEAPVSFTVRLDSPLQERIISFPDGIAMDGYAAHHTYPVYFDPKDFSKKKFLYDPERGIHFRTRLHAEADGKPVPGSSGKVSFEGVRQATIYLTDATSFNGAARDPVTEGKPYRQLAEARIRAAVAKGADELRRRQQQDYGELFGRVSLDLGRTEDDIKRLPTDAQLRRYSKFGEANPELEALYFQFARYLLISCSRTEGVPATLQGLWNESMEPPWSSNYTLNINLEENYWPVETAALPEMHEPLMSFLHELSVNGTETARRIYGVQEGWNAGHNSDIWAMACPVGLGDGDPSWANWTMGGAWLSTHIWEHYLFTRDTEALRRNYPVLKGAAEFCMGWLIEKDGELITSPSTSPENLYVTDKNYVGETLYGATADLAITRECLLDAIQAARELGTDEEFIHAADSCLQRLRPYHITADGRLLEWYHPWKDRAPRHRHQSHLIGAYPGHHIKGDSLARATLRTLETKGFETTGWSCGWRINLYARLGDGENAYRMLRRLLRYVKPDGSLGPNASKGGTYPNFFDSHAPFQIDGNFGGCAGMMEMLLQSDRDSLQLLPALPRAWKSGSVRGLRTRRGTAVDFTWEDWKITSFEER